MNILITGINGFVGSNLLDYYSSREDVRITGMIKNEKQKNELKHSKIHKLLTQEEVLSQFEFDAVIHLAGKAHDVKKVADKREYYISNEKLTIDLYDAFLAQRKRDAVFIFVSSISVFSKGSKRAIDEREEPSPDTPYGKSKFRAEKYIQNQTLNNGKRYCILRPTIIYGVRSKGNLNLLYDMIESGIPYPLGSFHNKKSFLSVYNLCYVIDKVTKKNIPSDIYHIADDDVISTLDIVKLINKCLGRRNRILKVPKRMVYLLARIGDRVQILINTERVSKLTGDFVVSNSKLKEALAIELPVSTKEGLKIVFSTFAKSQKWKRK